MMHRTRGHRLGRLGIMMMLRKRAFPFLLGLRSWPLWQVWVTEQDTPSPRCRRLVPVPQQSFVATFQPPEKLLEAHDYSKSLRELAVSEEDGPTDRFREGVGAAHKENPKEKHGFGRNHPTGSNHSPLRHTANGAGECLSPLTTTALDNWTSI